MVNLKQRYAMFSAICLLIIPLIYINNAYFDLTSAKFRAMLCVALPIIIGIFVVASVSIFKRTDKSLCRISGIKICIFVFTLISLVSCLISSDIKASFFGSKGWWVGAFTYIALTLIYLYLSDNIGKGDGIWITVFAVNILLMIFGALQFGGCDILGYSERLLPKQYYQYISTYGNTNWYAGYLCLIFPMASVFFLSAKTRFSYYFYLIFIALASLNMLIIITDGLYIGLIVCMAVAIPFIFKSKEKAKRTVLIGMIFSVQAIIIELLPCYNPLREYASGISALALDIRLSSVFLIIFLCLYILIKSYKGDFDRLSRVLIYIVLGLTLFVITLGVVYSALTFTDSFGSHRGLIWRASVERFSYFSLKEKLFGLGPDMLRGYYTDVERVFEGLAVVSSHSEPLQTLMTMGIIGAVSRLSVALVTVYTFTKVLKKRKGVNTERLYAYFLPITAYLSQSLVNSATTVNLCLLTVIFSYFTYECARQ